MTAGSQQDLNAIRDFLLDAFNANDFEDLLAFAGSEPLRNARNEYVESDCLPAKIRKTLDYCQHRGLIPDLLAEIERRRPQRYPELWAALPGAAAVVLALPGDLADFTGREADLVEVRAQLDQEGAVAISGIHGMGGIGKTALAVHLAHRLITEGRFRDAQLYLDLKGTDPLPVAPANALESLLNAVAGTNPNRPGEVEALAALWRAAIRGQDALLILDNARDTVQVRPLLPGCATCAVLVTSRRRFTLPGAGRLDLRRMARAEARKLLQTLAPRLDDDQADAVAALCGDLPLALRVAGNYLGLNDDCPPGRYAEMLKDERTRLARLRDPEDPDLDVAAAISLSVTQLGDDLRQAWALLALFPAPFDLHAAAALWEGLDESEALDCLQSLRNRSLASYDGETVRYYQHDLVRLAAAGELEAADEGDVEAARLRLARHYEQVARAAKGRYRQGDEGVLAGLALFDQEWPHIMAGQAWAAARAEEDNGAAWLCSAYPDAAVHLLSLRLHPRDRIAWLEAAARAARRLGNREAEGNHLGNLGIAYWDMGNMEEAILQFGQALAIARELGNRRGESTWLGNLGNAYGNLGELEKAIDHYQQALDIGREIGDRLGEGRHLGNLGITYAELGETEKAIEHHQQALDIARQMGDRVGEAYRLGSLGTDYQKLGEVERAIEIYKQALAIAREIDDRRGENIWLGSLGLAYKSLGDREQAIDHFQQALVIAREIGDRGNEANSSWNLGLMYEKADPARAIDLMSVCVAFEQEIGHPRAEANAARVEEIRKCL